MADGTRLGDWIVGALLGSGDTSAVHVATHVDDPERKAAIKVLTRPDPATAARFRREAEILESLDHPNIVKVRSLDLEDVLPYLELEYVPGRSLRDVLLDGPPPVATALGWALQVLDALVYLHARNVHHRDLCTSNLVLAGDRVVLVDFGLASLARAGETAVGARIGAVNTAPPEWIRDRPIDGDVWDLYAFGLVLYELLTGREGFPASPGEPEHLRAAHVMAEKRRVDALDCGDGFPDDLCQLVRDLTARDPKLRPRTAIEVRDRLKAVVPPAVEPVRPEPPREELSKEFRQASAVGTAVTIALGVGALALFLAVAWRLGAWVTR
ncbi:MAG: serine/threonine protein kinase [Alphaproteobacteria bacterium]|nr:serine/threonine protein kinase [Alphaproteobacteria bacterium]